MNTKLLRKIQKHILEEPKRLFMDSFVDRMERYENSNEFLRATNRDFLSEIPPCGTTGCIAGWAVLFELPEEQDDDIRRWNLTFFQDTGARLLDISDKQAEMLFYTQNWPDGLGQKHDEAKSGSMRRAKITSKRIDLFIKSKGKK